MIISFSFTNIVIFLATRFTPLYVIEFNLNQRENRILYLTKEFLVNTGIFKDYDTEKTVQDCVGNMLCLLKVATYSGYIPSIFLLANSLLSFFASILFLKVTIEYKFFRRSSQILLGFISLSFQVYYYLACRSILIAIDHVVLEDVKVEISPWIWINFVITVLKGTALGFFWFGAAASTTQSENKLLLTSIDGF